MTRKRNYRLRRSAAALEQGNAILRWLQQPEQRAALIDATERGLPAVAGIGAGFAAEFGLEAGKAMIVRQFVGRVVKDIMLDEGFVVVDTGIKLPSDPVFRSGSRYGEPDEAATVTENAGLLERFVSILMPSERRHLMELLSTLEALQ